MVNFHHPTGNANVRAAAMSFLNAGILGNFHTSVATFPGNIFDQISHFRPFVDFGRRRFDVELEPFTEQWPWYEIGRLTASKVGLHKLIKHESGIFSIDSVYQNLDRHVASKLKYATKRRINAVYAYEDGAAFSFFEAKRLGLKCLYDLPTGYWRSAQQLLKIERERWPEWIPTMTGFQDSEAKLSRKDEELRLADRIFVASKFTAKTLQDFPGNLAPINIIPYGFPPVNILIRDYSLIATNRPLKLLFVGKLSQQKGIANLFAAVEGLRNYVKLTVIGHKPNNDCPALDVALAKHQWIPSLPHDKVLRLMQEHDVLVFPSLFDGFGLVITEAMSQGTPVIATDRSAGPDLIKHGQNGWLVEAGSTQALRTAIENLLHHPNVIADVGRAAMETARSRPWEVYGQELSEKIKTLLCIP